MAHVIKVACLSWVPVALPLTFLTLGPRRELVLCLWETPLVFFLPRRILHPLGQNPESRE